MPSSRPRIRPLLVRPGARFHCFGDGLCCTDIHALGPLTRSEARDLRARSRLSVHVDPGLQEVCLRPKEDGGCHFQVEGLCDLHARFGPEAKPAGCRRFPFGLVKTPLGGRITTEHRCPCRTLGARPPLSLALAEQSLKNRAGRLVHDSETPNDIPMTETTSVSFARYAEIEAGLLQRLADGERAEEVLDAKPLAPLYEGSWTGLATLMLESTDPGAGGVATHWFADALLELSAGCPPPPRARPWAPAFEKGVARSQDPADPEAMLNDWVADELWMFRWLEWEAPFDVGRAELATRLAVARVIARRTERLGVPAEQATAEAIMVAEIALHADGWTQAVGSTASDPSPASVLARAR